ncbi:MAG: DUF1207 domain-containing protein [Candidatus Marinimicrobia bacterium]|nr:DUF1207 domain-containing protein [Candidatus Neomarinimicrobiota bacterium]
MKRLLVKIVLYFIALQSFIFASSFTFFTPELFGKPFVSDIRSSIIKFEEGFINDLGNFYYIPNYDKRPFSELHIGTDIPLLSYRMHSDKAYLKVTSVFTGVCTVILDALEPTHRMVINTDYWLGMEFRSVLYHPMLEKLKLRNIGLNFIPIFHESTHLGDEFVIYALNEGTDFYRLNVSYESWVISLTLNDPDTLKGNIFSTRIGMQDIWFKSDGFYQYKLSETQGQDLLMSERLFEYWLQLNWRRTKGFAASEMFHQITSLELRDRIKYGYIIEDPERRTWNINAYIGWEYQSKSDRKVGGYLRTYYGINPHGQLRNIDGFYFVGLSLVLM